MEAEGRSNERMFVSGHPPPLLRDKLSEDPVADSRLRELGARIDGVRKPTLRKVWLMGELSGV